jgi:hypothetical protein
VPMSPTPIVRIVRPDFGARPGAARQYKYFIRDTDWNICSIRVVSAG